MNSLKNEILLCIVDFNSTNLSQGKPSIDLKTLASAIKDASVVCKAIHAQPATLGV